jgi:hypothetical protein
MPDTVFWGYQLVILEPIEGAFRRKIRSMISGRTETDSARTKAGFYAKLAEELRLNFFAAEYGFWGLDDSKSSADTFDSWVEEISESISIDQAEMSHQENELGEPDIDRISCEKNYIAITVLFLIERSEQNEQFYKRISSIDEDESYDKYTFERILDLFSMLDFGYVASDAVFVVPGNDEDGLSWEDIHGEGWQYLKPIL